MKTDCQSCLFLIRQVWVWIFLPVLTSCDKDPDPGINPVVCIISGCTVNKVEGNRYEGKLSDTVFQYTYTFSDSMLTTITAKDGSDRFEFAYKDKIVVKRARYDGDGNLMYYDTFIYNDLNLLLKLERFDGSHISLLTYQALYSGTLATLVIRTNVQPQQTKAYAFDYEDGDLTGFTIDASGYYARCNGFTINEISIQDLILTVRDITPIDFALVSSAHPVYHISSYGAHQPVSSTGLEYIYKPTCYNLPLKELIIRDTAFEFTYYLSHYKIQE